MVLPDLNTDLSMFVVSFVVLPLIFCFLLTSLLNNCLFMVFLLPFTAVVFFILCVDNIFFVYSIFFRE